MMMASLTPQQQQAILEEWLRVHQERINLAVLDACEAVDGVSEAMTTLGASDDQVLREKIGGVLTFAAQGTLPETMRDQFDVVFADQPVHLREALKRQAEVICREQLSIYVDHMIERAKGRGR